MPPRLLKGPGWLRLKRSLHSRPHHRVLLRRVPANKQQSGSRHSHQFKSLRWLPSQPT
jgi:hypothetical protein